MRGDRSAWWATTLLLWGAFALSSLACGGASSNTPPEAEAGDEDGEEEEGDGEAKRKRKPMERPVSDHGKKWGGWRWKGKSEDCFYLHKNQCYPSLDEACRAAKCVKPDCVHDDGAPAKVSCEE